MKKSLFYALLLLFSLNPFGCTQENPERTKIVAKINDYNLPLDEFQQELATALELDIDLKLTKETKREFLEELIRKELLIQEAKRMGLDEREKFMKSMERYWESTLIRDLMDFKGKEISEKTYVSQDEVENYYKKRQISEQDLPPLREIEAKITKELKEKKKIGLLRDWIIDLRKNAKIEINEEILVKN